MKSLYIRISVFSDMKEIKILKRAFGGDWCN